MRIVVDAVAIGSEAEQVLARLHSSALGNHELPFLMLDFCSAHAIIMHALL